MNRETTPLGIRGGCRWPYVAPCHHGPVREQQLNSPPEVSDGVEDARDFEDGDVKDADKITQRPLRLDDRRSELAVVDVPSVAEREHVERVLVAIPVDDYAVVPDVELGGVGASHRFEKVVRPIPNALELLLDPVARLGVQVLQAVTGPLGEVNVRPSLLEVLECDRLPTRDLLAARLDVLVHPVGERRRREHVPERVADELALVHVVGVRVEERFNIVLHLLGNLYVQCTHAVTRVLQPVDDKKSPRRPQVTKTHQRLTRGTAESKHRWTIRAPRPASAGTRASQRVSASRIAHTTVPRQAGDSRPRNVSSGARAWPARIHIERFRLARSMKGARSTIRAAISQSIVELLDDVPTAVSEFAEELDTTVQNVPTT